MAVLHKIPAVLNTRIALPNTDDSDETQVLLGFRNLVNLFWEFDQSGIFELLDRTIFDLSALDNVDPFTRNVLFSLQRTVANSAFEADQMNDIQAIDMAVTRQWMRVILWKLKQRHEALGASPLSTDSSWQSPIQIAKDFLTSVSHIPDTAIESHGPGLVR